MQRMIKTLSVLGVFLFTTLLNGQVQSEAYMQYQQQVDEIFTESLTKGHAYARLGELCKDIGARLSGSWGKNVYDANFSLSDTVF